LDLDGGHLVKAASLISVRKAMEYLYDNTAQSFNPGRYRILHERASAICKPRPNPQPGQWAAQGFLLAHAPQTLVAGLASGLAFQPMLPERAQLDWAACVNGLREGVEYAQPSLAQLQQAAEWFGVGEGAGLLHADAACELSISAFRPVRVSAPALGSEPAAPLGARRGVLMLAGEAELLLFAPGGQLLFHALLSAGQLLWYDPNRLRCEYVPLGVAQLVELAAIARIPKHPFRVVYNGAKDYPVDPFSYGVKQAVAAPPFAGEKVLERARLPYYDSDEEPTAKPQPAAAL
jgi:hypothetical protein